MRLRFALSLLMTLLLPVELVRETGLNDCM